MEVGAMMLEALGAQIREARTRLGLTQNDIAGSLQVSAQAVSKWERGENAPDIALLPVLARLLGVTVDRLLGTHVRVDDTVEATICFSVIKEFTRRSEGLDPREIATAMNAHYLQITETALRFDGVPVKYIGDAFLYFFAGPEHRLRAVNSAVSAVRLLDERVGIGMNTGQIYIGRLGHPDYSRLDVMGDAVNLAFRVASWTGKTESRIGASEETVTPIADLLDLGKEEIVEPKGMERKVHLFEIIGVAK